VENQADYKVRFRPLYCRILVIGILLTAHIAGDYFLQQFAIFKLKRDDQAILLLHAFIWASCVGAALKLLGRFTWWKYICLLVVHAIIDYWKLHCNPYPTSLTVNIFDQMLHMLQLWFAGRGGKSHLN